MGSLDRLIRNICQVVVAQYRWSPELFRSPTSSMKLTTLCELLTIGLLVMWHDIP